MQTFSALDSFTLKANIPYIYKKTHEHDVPCFYAVFVVICTKRFVQSL